ncbi:MAG TPA: hypothetical protein PK252_00150 [Bacteroidales bacterium]|nr:hypothetical protein [Bacteroidales bacterium]
MRKIGLICLLLMVSGILFSQKWKLTRYELMYGVGVSNYFGDIGSTSNNNNLYGIKDIRIFNTRPSFMVGARYKIKQKFHTRVAFSFIMLNGDDSRGSYPQRNYSFNTFGLEQSGQVEYALLSEDRNRTSFAVYNKRGIMYSRSRLGLYAFAGVGGLFYIPFIDHSNPDPSYKGDHFSSGPSYTGIAFGGIMLKTIYSNYLALSLEFGPRFVIGDDLDGLTSKFSKFNDMYYYLNFSVIYRIKTSRKGYPMLFKRY